MTGIFSSLVSLALQAWDSYNSYRQGDAAQVATQMEELNISVTNLQSAIAGLKAQLADNEKADAERDYWLKITELQAQLDAVKSDFTGYFAEHEEYFKSLKLFNVITNCENLQSLCVTTLNYFLGVGPGFFKFACIAFCIYSDAIVFKFSVMKFRDIKFNTSYMTPGSREVDLSELFDLSTKLFDAVYDKILVSYSGVYTDRPKYDYVETDPFKHRRSLEQVRIRCYYLQDIPDPNYCAKGKNTHEKSKAIIPVDNSLTNATNAQIRDETKKLLRLTVDDRSKMLTSDLNHDEILKLALRNGDVTVTSSPKGPTPIEKRILQQHGIDALGMKKKIKANF
jgi:hypothetical protein